MTSAGVPRRALWTAVLVGTILNLINQGDALLAGQPLQVGKAMTTYCVPIALRRTARCRSVWRRRSGR